MSKTKLVVTNEQKRRALADLDGTAGAIVLNKDDRYVYFLGAKDSGHPQSVGALTRIGYEVVNRENNSGEVLPGADVEDSDGGPLQTGDTVLMRLPKELYDLRQEKMQDVIAQRTSQTQEAFEQRVEEAERMGGGNKSVFVFGTGRNQSTSG